MLLSPPAVEKVLAPDRLAVLPILDLDLYVPGILAESAHGT
jgi:hypothetical protein